MQPIIFHARCAFHCLARPTVQILAGLIVLSIALVFPALPASTGMALVALGATATTIERFQTSPARGPLLLANLLIYSAIYLLFVGAVLDAAARTGAPLSLLAALDLAISLAPMTAVVRAILTAILSPLRTEY